MPEVATAPTPPKAKIAPPKKVTVLVMSTHPQPFIQLHAESYEPETVTHKGKTSTHYKPNGDHYHVQFARHECEIPAEWMPTFRTINGYGTDFNEVLPITVQQNAAGDDAVNSMPLTEIMQDPQGIGFVKAMVRRSAETVTKQFAKTEEYVRGRIEALRKERVALIKSGRNELKSHKPTE